MGHIEILKSKSLSSALQEQIEHMILDGQFAPGDRINEYALGTRFGISRGPIREACRALAEKGLVELKPNRGAFVRNLAPRELEELYELRAGLFALAARLAAERISSSQLKILHDFVDRMEDLAKTGAVDEYFPINLEFHAAVLKAAGNERLEATYHRTVKELSLYRAKGLAHGDSLVSSNREHRELIEAIGARDPGLAAGAAFKHVMGGRARLAKAQRDPVRKTNARKAAS